MKGTTWCKFNQNGNPCITWNILIQDKTVRVIQEPISEMLITKDEFMDAYNSFMETLDGRDMTSYIDFFWKRSPIDEGILEFVDQDSRLDIYDLLLDMDLVPDMDKVHSGDWKFQ
jgi:hypothetical protein